MYGVIRKFSYVAFAAFVIYWYLAGRLQNIEYFVATTTCKAGQTRSRKLDIFSRSVPEDFLNSSPWQCTEKVSFKNRY